MSKTVQPLYGGLQPPRPNPNGVSFYTEGGEHRWRIKADNGKIIGASTESYKNKIDCINNLKQVAQEIIDYCDSEPKSNFVFIQQTRLNEFRKKP